MAGAGANAKTNSESLTSSFMRIAFTFSHLQPAALAKTGWQWLWLKCLRPPHAKPTIGPARIEIISSFIGGGHFRACGGWSLDWHSSSGSAACYCHLPSNDMSIASSIGRRTMVGGLEMFTFNSGAGDTGSTSPASSVQAVACMFLFFRPRVFFLPSNGRSFFTGP